MYNSVCVCIGRKVCASVCVCTPMLSYHFFFLVYSDGVTGEQLTAHRKAVVEILKAYLKSVSCVYTPYRSGRVGVYTFLECVRVCIRTPCKSVWVSVYTSRECVSV